MFYGGLACTSFGLIARARALKVDFYPPPLWHAIYRAHNKRVERKFRPELNPARDNNPKIDHTIFNGTRPLRCGGVVTFASAAEEFLLERGK